MDPRRIRRVGGISIAAATVLVGLAMFATGSGDQGPPGTAAVALDSPGIPAAAARAPAGPFAHATGQATLFRVQQAIPAAPSPRVDDDMVPVAVQVSRQAALLGARGGRLDIALPDGSRYPLRFEREERAAGGNWTFVGRVETA